MAAHIVHPNGSETWINEYNEYHREDGPAFIGWDGTQAWFQNGKRHRLDGPAVIWPDGRREWWINGKLHRMDGPAIVDPLYDTFYEWYVNDSPITGDVLQWMKEMGIRSDWENWGDVEKILFRLRF